MRVLYDIDLPQKDPLPSTSDLKTNMSIDGLIFWDWETSIKRELEISTIILSSNKEISALIPLTNKWVCINSNNLSNLRCHNYESRKPNHASNIYKAQRI